MEKASDLDWLVGQFRQAWRGWEIEAREHVDSDGEGWYTLVPSTERVGVQVEFTQRFVRVLREMSAESLQLVIQICKDKLARATEEAERALNEAGEGKAGKV